VYSWLLFVHVLSVGAFLFAHGVAGGASFLLRGPVSASTRSVLRVSQRSSLVANPALVLLIITGIWMTFAGHWSGRAWPWVALGLLIVVLAVMTFVSLPYYKARDAAEGPDDALAASLARTQPLLAASVGTVGLVLLFGLMVFKPF
jgi:uncharacterized membrane protein